MPKAIRIGSRKSDLARLQAMLVGDELVKRGHRVEFAFKEAPGDVNLVDPLWKMPQVGVFTSFLHEYLVNGEVDVVVHSWKDLPIDPQPGTEVIATLPRGDTRDLLLVRKDSLGSLVVLTSSPRRQHNLQDFLRQAVPGISDVSFKDVRGNIQTRMNKLLQGNDANALLVAKAAVDRFLSTDISYFQAARDTVRRSLDACDWAVLPISVNPTAAAQGALALEICSARADIRGVISEINHRETFEACALERETLKKMGGGCHQKIGCSVLTRNFGQIFSVRGLQPDGLEIEEFKILSPPAPQAASAEKIACVGGKSGNSIFSRHPKESDLPARLASPDPPALFLAKAEALPAGVPRGVPVWTAGVESWLKLAARGVWVNGCSDRLGEAEGFGIDLLLDRPRTWLKLSHDKSPPGWMETLSTYSLQDLEMPSLNFQELSHVYWSSGSAFEAAVAKNPEICSRLIHGCGPGHTLEAVSKKIPREKIIVALSFEEFRERCLSYLEISSPIFLNGRRRVSGL